MKPLAQAIEDKTYEKFLREVRNITHKNFEKTEKRTRILKKLTEEIQNLDKTSKNNLPEREEIIQMNQRLLIEKENNLQKALEELEQCDKEIRELTQEQFEQQLKEVNDILNS